MSQFWDARQRAVMSHAINRRQRPESEMRGPDAEKKIPRIDSYLQDDILKANFLPDANTRRDNFVAYLATKSAEPGDVIPHVATLYSRAAIGTMTSQSASWTIKHALRTGLVQGNPHKPEEADILAISNVGLTPAGWDHYASMLKDSKDSRVAFMAMKFNDPELDTVFASCFQPAAARAGYTLLRVDSNPEAGLIDDQMMVQIRRARFMIADLTHANKGAYWEAGFAEGLSRPVIYTCRADHFKEDTERDKRPHFDINHRQIVRWEDATPLALQKTGNQLTAIIRNTMPSEAKLED